jgi:hypothetical protein
MKKLFLLLVIVGGVHAIAWSYIADQAETNLRQLIEHKMRYSMGDLTYSLEKSGYPTKVTLEMADMKLSAPSAGVTLDSHSDKAVSISVPFTLDPHKFIIDATGLEYVINLTSVDGDVTINLAVDKSTSIVTEKDGNYTLDGFMENLSIKQNMPDQGTFTIDVARIDMKETSSVTDNKINSDVVVNMTDAKVNAHVNDKDISFNLDSYAVKGGVKDFPNSFDELIQQLTSLIEKAADGEKSFDMVDIKQSIKDFIQQMAENKSVIYFDDISYKLSGLPEVESFGLALKTELNIADDHSLRGTIGIKLDGLDKIAQMWMKGSPTGSELSNMPPFALAFMQAGTLELNLKTNDEGMLIFNEMPVFPMPSLDDWIDGIPDTFSSKGTSVGLM